MIRIVDLCKSFAGKRVLDGVNLTILDGSTVVVLGRSGQGKTVFLKHIIGLLKPNRGKIFLDNLDIIPLSERELNKLRLQFGVVFQENALFDFLTVKENVGFLLYEYSFLFRSVSSRVSEHTIDERVRRVLGLVGMEGTERLYPQELSGGMKKRVAIARAILLNPQYIIYDEPTTGIDPITSKKIDFLIRDLHDKLNITSIVVTHDLNCAFYIADKIAFLNRGRVIFEGRKEEFLSFDDSDVKDFIESFYTISKNVQRNTDEPR